MVAVFALPVPHIIVLAPLSRSHILESQKSQRCIRSAKMGHATRDLNDHGPEEEVFVEPAMRHHASPESSESSQKGEITDAVFGEVGADGPNYRSVSD